jgi:hypothetical protein
MGASSSAGCGVCAIAAKIQIGSKGRVKQNIRALDARVRRRRVVIWASGNDEVGSFVDRPAIFLFFRVSSLADCAGVINGAQTTVSPIATVRNAKRTFMTSSLPGHVT